MLMLLKAIAFFHLSHILERLTLAEYHEQEEIFKLRLGHLKKVCPVLNLFLSIFNLSGVNLSSCAVQAQDLMSEYIL